MRLTEAGVDLFYRSGSWYRRRRKLDPERAEQFDRLHEAGLLDERGRATEDAQPALRALRNPWMTVTVQATAGQFGRQWIAQLGPTHAWIIAHPSPAIGPHLTAEQVAALDESHGKEFEVQIVPLSWTPVAACQWIGINPREARPTGLETKCISRDSLVRRVADPAEPCPEGIDPEFWAQPMLLWAVITNPGGAHCLVLDTGHDGLWQVQQEDSDVELEAALPHDAWRLIVRAMNKAERIATGEPAEDPHQD